MLYTLDKYFAMTFSVPNAPRVIIYPDNDTAARVVNHHKSRGSVVIEVADCLTANSAILPMPNILLNAIDEKIKAQTRRSSVVGLDAYLLLLDAEGIRAFLSGLRLRLDENLLDVDYLLSSQIKLDFVPRYMESRRVIFIDGKEDVSDPLGIQAYSRKWVKAGDSFGYKQLLGQLGNFMPSGAYTLILDDFTEKQAGIGNTVTVVHNIRDIAAQYHSLDVELDDITLELLLSNAAESGQSAEILLANQFGIQYINERLALKRLGELAADDLWRAYIWLLRKRLPSDSYIAKVLSMDVTHENLLWKYVVGSVIHVLTDINSKKYAEERADALRALGTDYESLIVEFIEQTKENADVLPFLNCGTNSERIEIVRRASKEDMSYGLQKQYAELYPALADYLSSAFKYDDAETTRYFSDYRRIKLSGLITNDIIKRAFSHIVPKTYPTRDSVIAELHMQLDTALLVVDAMGAEYMSLLLAMAKRRGMNIESQAVVTAKLPTDTEFNQINWDKGRRLPEIKSIDNIVHNGAVKHEAPVPERNLVEILNIFETEVMKRVADGLTRFERVVLTADHGASRLAVIAHNEGKSTTLPWQGEPDDWRYSLAPHVSTRPPEFEQEYFPETQKTYWIVRGYNRLPKRGGKLYELHGGATLEERLVPVVVFTKNAAVEIQRQIGKKKAANIVDEFEGII